MWISGLRVVCEKCKSQRRPQVTKELWDAHDQVVVGCATCKKCDARFLFTRYLTAVEAKVQQQQGQPIRTATRS